MKDTILNCGHRPPMALLTENSQGNLTFQVGFVSRIHVGLLRNTGASCIGISHQIIDDKDISDEYIMCVTFGGKIERVNLCNIHVGSPYISDFLALVQPQQHLIYLFIKYQEYVHNDRRKFKSRTGGTDSKIGTAPH